LPGADQVNRNLMALADRQKAALLALSEQYAARMEAYAKANKRWQDRTGNARQGLFGYSIMRDQSLITRVAHTVDYGVYLELANQGRFAILLPTVRRFVADYLEDAKRVMSG
jgi:hypothetical protein